MQDLSNSSFIPKRGPTKNKRRTASKQLYFFSILSYVVFFATLIASGGVFFYDKYVESQLAKEVVTLSGEIEDFSEEKMQDVLTFDLRLAQASDRISHSVSVGSIFKAIERATIDTVQINSLSLTREGDEKYLLEATLETDSFDSTIFQRNVYKDDSTLASVEFASLQASSKSDTTSEDGSNQTEPSITFTANIGIPVSEIPYEINPVRDTPITITPASYETEAEIFDESEELQDGQSEEEVSSETDL